MLYVGKPLLMRSCWEPGWVAAMQQLPAPLGSSLRGSTAPFLHRACSRSSPAKGVISLPMGLFRGIHLTTFFPPAPTPVCRHERGNLRCGRWQPMARPMPWAMLGSCPAHCPQPSRSFSGQETRWLCSCLASEGESHLGAFRGRWSLLGRCASLSLRQKNPINPTWNSFPAPHRQG